MIFTPAVCLPFQSSVLFEVFEEGHPSCLMASMTTAISDLLMSQNGIRGMFPV